MQTASTFEKEIKQALKWLDDPMRLGESSPLAAPYFLSHLLEDAPDAATDQRRGQALITALHNAAATLWGEPLPQSLEAMRAALREVRQQPGTPRYSYLILELRCFQRYLRPRRMADIWEDEAYLPGSRAEHYRDFDLAVEHLGQALLRNLHPTLHAEQPAAQRLVGYGVQLAQAGQALQAGKTVAVSGPGGVGKTALGALLYRQASGVRPTFWYTLRVNLTDRLTSLLFALGHFLHTHGASHLWQLLLTAGGRVDDAHLALAMVRQDWAMVQPLICLDEMDILDQPDPEQALPAHLQLLEFIGGLAEFAPLLMIGQRALFSAGLHLELTGLATPQIQALIQQEGVQLAPDEVEQLYHYTHGNPRLILLCLALYTHTQTAGETPGETHRETDRETLAETLAHLPAAPGIVPILRRLWTRLDSAERRMLQRLAVFRSPSPASNRPDEAAVLARLAQRRLVQLDGAGGVELHMALRAPIYADLSADLRQRLHAEAAGLRGLHGEYTSAAFHYVQAGRAGEAIQLWYPHRLQEIGRGRGEVALALLRDLPRRGLGKAERNALDLSLAELFRLNSDLEAGRRQLEVEDWHGEREAVVRAAALRGEFLEALGFPDSALSTYGDAILVTSRLLGQLVQLRRQRSMVHLRQKRMDKAWQEAKLAECQLLNLRGELEEEAGRYAEALALFQEAWDLADALDDPASLALTEGNLASVYGRKQDVTQAVAYSRRAIDRCRAIGDYFTLAKLNVNLAYIFIQTRRFPEAVEASTVALRTYKAMNTPYYAANAAVNLAEAAYETGDLVRAESAAHEALAFEEAQSMPYALYTLGQVQRAQAHFGEAEAYYQESAHLAQLNQDPYMAAYALRALGELYVSHGQAEMGEAKLREALTLFRTLEMGDELAQTEALLQGATRTQP
jgi:tetratricopeptide (TPR) repeat protein